MFYYSSPAIVLKKEEFSESDLFFIFFSQEAGRIKVLAKGSRKINSKLKPFLRIGNLVNLEMVFKNQYRLLGVGVVDALSSLRKNFNYFLKFLTDLSFAEEMVIFAERDLSLWKLFFSYAKIANFSSQRNSEKTLIISSLFFKTKLVELLGFLPSFEEYLSFKKIEKKKEELFLPFWQEKSFSQAIKILQKLPEKELSFVEKNLNSYLKKIKKRAYE